MKKIPFWEQYVLTLQEASAYFRIGETKMRQIVTENETASFILMNGNRTLIKRRLFEQFIDSASVI